jgi:hypothetical protein
MVERIARGRELAERKEAAESERLFGEATKSSATPTDWRTSEGDMAARLAEQGRCADLIVVGQYEAQGVAERRPTYLAEDLVLAAGRPVLVVPEPLRRPYQLRRVLIGWDGGRSASRAVHDSLPLLIQSRPRIEIVAFDEGRPPHALALAAHLGRYGLTADIVPAPAPPASHGAGWSANWRPRTSTCW